VRTEPRTASAAVSGGAAWVLAAAVLWGTTGTAQALAPTGASPLAVAAMRLAIGGAALFALAAWRGSFRAVVWRHPAALLAGASIALYQVAFFSGLLRTGVAVGTLIAIGSSPVVAGALEMLVARRRPTLAWLAATAVAVGGCALLLMGDGTWRVDAGGVLLALLAGASFALYTVAGKSLLRTVSADVAVPSIFVAGALLLAPLLFTTRLNWLANPRGLAVALHLGLIATAAAHGLYMRGLTTVSAAAGATLTLAEPLTAALLSVVVLGERLTAAAWLGAALVLAALAVLARTAAVAER